MISSLILQSHHHQSRIEWYVEHCVRKHFLVMSLSRNEVLHFLGTVHFLATAAKPERFHGIASHATQTEDATYQCRRYQSQRQHIK